MIRRMCLLIIGLISLGLAIIGIIVPLIPTTPLLLLAATCFVRCSDRLYEWLITQKHLGPYIKNYREGKGIPLSAKITGVILLWTSMLFTIFFVVPLIAVKLILAGVAAFFTWYILKQKTLI
ncbi:YbaN family protein [Ornithinibacillus sp. BX22]|uniref:YbaN family protein n=2 Tax=Ornithinibacillus TaxID=484508 RepID=A0A923L5K1_9BACI|nr:MULTISPECIES: YbaN family protein [Ornithinibacillus]MBC5636918.1 YbaN family protein [Ornithinibacillus hominis]MBS3681484.1 YbaN family protein [Ornithinibacillus massiliensis]